MTNSAKIEGVTGIVTVGFAGISASFTASDLNEWGQVIISLFPYILIFFLLWRVSKLAAQHKDCMDNHMKLQKQMLFSYQVMQTVSRRNDLPAEHDFLTCNFEASPTNNWRD